MSKCWFFGICLSSVLWASQICGLMSFFLLLLVFPLHIYYNYYNCPTVLGYSFWVLFHPLIPLLGILDSLYWCNCKSTDCFLGQSSLLISQKAFFISVTVFLISSTNFWFFQSFHLSAYTHLFLHFAHLILATLVYASYLILHAQSDNQKSLPYLIDSNASFVSSNCFAF